jgi:peptide/nickel transport system substrate-binding protein
VAARHTPLGVGPLKPVTVLLAVVATACSPATEAGTGVGATGTGTGEAARVTFASEQEPTGWNNATASESLLATAVIVENVYPSAFVQTPDLDVAMNDDLLVSAEQVADDPQVVEYRIREEARWSDGTPISADDFAYAWRQQNGSIPGNDVASTVGYERIASVEGSAGDKAVTVTFAEPFGPWEGLFYQLLPAHIMRDLPGGWSDGLDGTSVPQFSGGPFRLVDYTPGQSVSLVRNEAWWGEPPLLDEIVVRFGISAAALPQALANSEVDIAYPQPQIDLVLQIEDLAPEIQSQLSFGLSFEHLDFNLDHPFLAKKEVREAIALALDRDALVDATVAQFDDRAQRLDNRIWLTGQPHYEAHGSRYARPDIAAARSLLESAGFTEGDDGIYQLDGRRLSLRISTTAGDRLREDTELVILDQLAQVGIEITIDNREGSAVFERFFPASGDPADRDFDIALFAWAGSPFPSFNSSLYATGSGQNHMGYVNPDLDALFDEALAETDPVVRAQLYNRADELLWEDLPSLPLYTKATFLPYRSTIANVVDNPTTSGPLWNAEQWALQPR